MEGGLEKGGETRIPHIIHTRSHPIDVSVKTAPRPVRCVLAEAPGARSWLIGAVIQGPSEMEVWE